MSATPANVVGIVPWQPWPLSAWSWWSDPVRAERLAILRIGLALVLLWDVGTNYAPHVVDYFGKGGIGDPDIYNFAQYHTAPRANWSLLRGPGHEAGMTLALLIWIAMTVWIIGNALGRLFFHRKDPPANDRTGAALIVWTCAYSWYVAGVWAHALEAKKPTDLTWVLPLAGFSCACLFFALDLLQRLQDPEHQPARFAALFALAMTGTVLFHAGIALSDSIEPGYWAFVLKPWQEDEGLIRLAMALWLAAGFLLLVGCCTRFASVAAWMLSLSFANANHFLENAGDTIRIILLFYLMQSPCGAVWSVDALFAKRQGPVYVHPWPLRLIFVQMIFIYFMNGLYKLFGDDWLEGTSLYYVLGDLALARFSAAALPLPLEVTKAMAWSVLAWEVSFPLLVLFKWTRIPALLMGVCFHLGIFATMELGPFVPYALCMYLPLLPWERLSRRREEVLEVEIVDDVEPA